MPSVRICLNRLHGHYRPPLLRLLQHLRELCARYLKTKFIRINAEKSPFFVGKLSVSVCGVRNFPKLSLAPSLVSVSVAVIEGVHLNQSSSLIFLSCTIVIGHRVVVDTVPADPSASHGGDVHQRRRQGPCHRLRASGRRRLQDRQGMCRAVTNMSQCGCMESCLGGLHRTAAPAGNG